MSYIIAYMYTEFVWYRWLLYCMSILMDIKKKVNRYVGTRQNSWRVGFLILFVVLQGYLRCRVRKKSITQTRIDRTCPLSMWNIIFYCRGYPPVISRGDCFIIQSYRSRPSPHVLLRVILRQKKTYEREWF